MAHCHMPVYLCGIYCCSIQNDEKCCIQKWRSDLVAFLLWTFYCLTAGAGEAQAHKPGGVRPSGSAPAYPSGVISILPVVSSFCVLLLVFSTSCAVLGTISQLHWVQALQSMLAVVHVTFSLKGKREEGGEVGKDWAEEREWADRHTGPFWQFIMACRKEHYHLLALWALGNNGVLSEPHVP